MCNFAAHLQNGGTEPIRTKYSPMNKKLPLGIQDFESLREDGYLYVDKTKSLYDMVSSGRYFSLSRPRRFGKSLMLTTLKAYFEGKRELFHGLYVDSVETEWASYPILHLDLNAENYDSVEKLQQKLDAQLRVWENKYPTDFESYSPGIRFEQVIERAYHVTGRRVVILVDEYDKPMLQAIGNTKLQEAFRKTLKGFYGALKSKDACIKFAFLTGITKFAKVSIFSDLNNLNDISMDRQFHDICGITEKELIENFQEHIDKLAEACGINREACVEKLRQRYDGYHFHPKLQGIYNPYSVIKTFFKKEFGSYWFETGTPTYLVELLRRHDYNLNLMEHSSVESDILNSVDSESANPIPIIYQSGYLTIKGYDERFKRYKLGFPNDEVEEGFVQYLAPFYLSRRGRTTSFDISKFIIEVEEGEVDKFCQRLKALFADTPYELVKDLENHYQNIVWVMFKLMGFYVDAEYRTSDGRIDLLLRTQKYCYIIEFKLDGTAEEALQQIEDKAYALPFELDGQRIFRIGMNFSSETRNIERYIIR